MPESISFPSLSIIIPTLNSAGTLERCLKTIQEQDYPPKSVEILICDGGSTDSTLQIAHRYHVHRILENPLKTGEAGKSVGLKHAQGNLIAFIDSDNFLVGHDWLRRMIAPFQNDPQIVMTEPLFFQWDPTAPPITRYCALMGMNDPLCYYTGNFDRWNMAIQSWTALDIPIHTEGDWFWFELSQNSAIPTLGANGTMYRREILGKLPPSDYFFDVDIPHQLLSQPQQRFVKVKTSILHWYCPTMRDFVRKQRRRVRDYLHHRQEESRIGHPQSYSYHGIFSFILSVLFGFPCLGVSIRGYYHKPDLAWFLHWPLSAITLWIYGTASLRSWWKPTSLDRTHWQVPTT